MAKLHFTIKMLEMAAQLSDVSCNYWLFAFLRGKMPVDGLQ